MSLIVEYIKLSKMHKEKSGPMTIVLMQVGKFFEIYALEDDRTALMEVCNILNMTLVRRDGKSGKNADVSVKNPLFCGFPEISLQKNIRKLVECSYTVVVYHQTGNNESTGKQNRELLGIYSPGTFVNDEASSTQDGTTMVGVYIENFEQLNGKTLCAMGFCSIDLVTGRVLVHEVHGKADEPNLPFDELVQLAQRVSPREVVIRAVGDSYKNAASCFELDANLIHDRKEVPKDYDRLAFQNELLERVFGKRSLSPIEELGLERSPFMVKALVLILEWAWDHVNTQMKGLRDPERVEPNRLVLGNSAIYQLNVLENTMLEGNQRKGIRSLFDVVNSATTVIGRRYLKRQLTSPLIDPEAIKARLNSVEKLVKDTDLCKNIGMALTGVMDIERLHRRMVVGSLGPNEFLALHNSYESLLSMNKWVKEIKDVDSSWLSDLKKIVVQYKTNIRMDRIRNGWNLTDIRENLFAHGVDTKLDDMDTELDEHVSFMTKTIKVFSDLLDCKLELVNTDRDGYLIRTTTLRGKALVKLLEKKSVTIDGVTINKVEIKAVGTACRILFPEFTKHGESRRKIETQLSQRMRKLWTRVMLRIYNRWESVLIRTVEGASHIDFLVSCSKTAINNNYCRPDIIDASKDGHSMVSCKQMRHPIIEQLIESTYVPHDISLSAEGILLYGSNASGKSTLSKCLGLLTIMAQCGMFVPAKSMKIIPYRYLFARITGNDNILRGLSSFAVEMLELKAMLKNAGSNSLFVGDELCRGTESMSGTAIVAAAVEQLAKSKTTFIFATHLHDLPSIPEIQSLKNVKVFHIHSTYDKETERITYERDLRPGQGDTIYGLNVACSMLKNTDFMNRANHFAKHLTGEKGELVDKRQSKWNADIYLTECTICNSKNELNVHHIRHRSKCVDKFSDHIRQDSKGNLVVLCRACHEKVHAGAIEVSAWVDTSLGRELKWHHTVKKETEKAILKMRLNYDEGDWKKGWAHSAATKELAKIGHIVTTDQVREGWCNEKNSSKKCHA
jgi:DNA mismatch repair protein MutS